MKQFMGIDLRVDLSMDQIIGLMRQMYRYREMHKDCMILAAINGYDDDPRELWEIPEVKTFAVKLVELGFISLLNAMPDPGERSGPLTAVHIWLLSRGELNCGGEVDLEKFEAALVRSNKMSALVLAGEK